MAKLRIGKQQTADELPEGTIKVVASIAINGYSGVCCVYYPGEAPIFKYVSPTTQNELANKAIRGGLKLIGKRGITAVVLTDLYSDIADERIIQVPKGSIWYVHQMCLAELERIVQGCLLTI